MDVVSVNYHSTLLWYSSDKTLSTPKTFRRIKDVDKGVGARRTCVNSSRPSKAGKSRCRRGGRQDSPEGERVGLAGAGENHAAIQGGAADAQLDRGPLVVRPDGRPVVCRLMIEAALLGVGVEVVDRVIHRREPARGEDDVVECRDPVRMSPTVGEQLGQRTDELSVDAQRLLEAAHPDVELERGHSVHPASVLRVSRREREIAFVRVDHLGQLHLERNPLDSDELVAELVSHLTDELEPPEELIDELADAEARVGDDLDLAGRKLVAQPLSRSGVRRECGLEQLLGGRHVDRSAAVHALEHDVDLELGADLAGTLGRVVRVLSKESVTTAADLDRRTHDSPHLKHQTG